MTTKLIQENILKNYLIVKASPQNAEYILRRLGMEVIPLLEIRQELDVLDLIPQLTFVTTTRPLNRTKN